MSSSRKYEKARSVLTSLLLSAEAHGIEYSLHAKPDLDALALPPENAYAYAVPVGVEKPVRVEKRSDPRTRFAGKEL